LPEASALTIDNLYERALRATAEGSKSFYFATRFFPRERARGAHAVYWFCRYTDDLVDECASIAQGRRELEAWASEVDAALAGGQPTHPVLIPFIDTVRRSGIPAEYPRDLMEGMRMDLDCTRYRTFNELRVFCYRVASVVGLMMCHVIGFDNTRKEEVRARASELGVAMQLTNILRDIGEDLNRGRIYIPDEDLERFAYREADLRARVRGEAFEELMRFQVKRARSFYASANPGIALLHPSGRFAVQIASDVYRGILGRIESSNFDVFDHRAYVRTPKKYWITARHLAGRVMALR